MNPIIGTLVNGENNITTNQSFLFSFRIISGSLERQANCVTNRFNAHLGILEEKGKKLSTKKTLNFRTFSNSQKTCQSRSYVAHTLYENYLVFSL